MNAIGDLTKVRPQKLQTRKSLMSTPSSSTVLGEIQITGPDGLIVLSQDIDFGATGVEEVFQNVKYIILTEYFSVPLDREFGMDFSMVDKPIPIAEAVLAQEIATKISLYEPRAQFKEVTFDGSGIDGKLDPNVLINIISTDEWPSLYPDLTAPEAMALVTVSPVTTPQSWPDFFAYLVEVAKQPGPIGPEGPQGKPGEAATVDVSATITGAPGSPANVTNLGDSYHAMLLFTIPTGAAGPQGPRGTTWFEGPSDPPDPIPGAISGDLYLNVTSGDVFKVS